ncbi:MAG: hypothetical protein UIV44_04530 [Bacteroidales bacterium]
MAVAEEGGVVAFGTRGARMAALQKAEWWRSGRGVRGGPLYRRHKGRKSEMEK